MEAVKTLANIYLQKDNDMLPSVSVADTDENRDKGIDLMVQSAVGGDRSSQIFMAKAYETGSGLGSKRTKDWKMSSPLTKD